MSFQLLYPNSSSDMDTQANICEHAGWLFHPCGAAHKHVHQCPWGSGHSLCLTVKPSMAQLMDHLYNFLNSIMSLVSISITHLCNQPKPLLKTMQHMILIVVIQSVFLRYCRHQQQMRALLNNPCKVLTLLQAVLSALLSSRYTALSLL